MNTTAIDYTDLFSEKSEAYAKFRPGYGQAAIAKIVAPFAGSSRTLAVDIGAGTGIASRLLADHGLEVIGIEPNVEMIRSAIPHNRVEYKVATAENTTLTSESADLVTCFMAFHWFNFKKSLAEFNRILKKNGRLAIVWNYWDESDHFTHTYARLIGQFGDRNPQSITPYPSNFTGFSKKWRIRFLWKFKILPYFSDVHRYTFPHSEPMNLQALIGCAKSQSYILHTGAEWNLLCNKIEDLYKKHDNPHLAHNINLFMAKPKKNGW